MKIWLPGGGQPPSEGIKGLAKSFMFESAAACQTITYLFNLGEQAKQTPMQDAMEDVLNAINETEELECVQIEARNAELGIKVILSKEFTDKDFNLVVSATATKMIDIMSPLSFVLEEMPNEVNIGFDPVGEVSNGDHGDYTNEAFVVLTEKDDSDIAIPTRVSLVYVMGDARPPGTGSMERRVPINRFNVRILSDEELREREAESDDDDDE